MKLVLASASPRRREILSLLNIQYEVRENHVDEEKIQQLLDYQEPMEIARSLSLKKAQSVANEMEEGLVLGADTIVVREGQIFGKPDSEKTLRKMISSLSGRTHQVITAVSLTNAAKKHSVSLASVTDVTFREISEEELDWYAENASYRDKAGGYAIQEHAALFVTGIQGCYYNVVGLPVQETLALLALQGVSWRDLQKTVKGTGIG